MGIITMDTGTTITITAMITTITTTPTITTMAKALPASPSPE